MENLGKTFNVVLVKAGASLSEADLAVVKVEEEDEEFGDTSATIPVNRTTIVKSSLAPNVPLDPQTIEVVQNIAEFFHLEHSERSPLFLTSIAYRTGTAVGLGDRTIRNIVENRKQTKDKDGKRTVTVYGTVNELLNKKPRPKTKKFDDDFLEESVRPIVERMLKENPAYTLRTMKTAIENELNVEFGNVTMSRFLRRFGYDYAKESSVNDKTKSLKTFLQQINEHRADGRQIFYQDQTWFSQSFINDQTVSSDVSAVMASCSENDSLEQNPERITLLHAGSSDGFVPNAAYVYRTSNVTQQIEEFEQWFEFVLAPKLPGNSVLVLNNIPTRPYDVDDGLPNAGSYKREMMKWLERMNIPYDYSVTKTELYETYVLPHLPKQSNLSIDDIAARRGIELIRFPAILRDVYPFQHIWKKLKRRVANKFLSLNVNDLAMLIETELTSITPKDWQNAISNLQIVEVKEPRSIKR